LSASRGPFVNSSQMKFASSASGRSAKQRGEAPKSSTAVPGPLPNIAPKPQNGSSAPSAETSRPKPHNQSNQGFQQSFHIFQGESAPSSAAPHGFSPEVTEGLPISNDTVDHSYLPSPEHRAFPRDSATHYDFNALFRQQAPSNYHPQVTQPPGPMAWTTNHNTQPYSRDHFRDQNRQFPTPSTPSMATPITAPHWQNPAFAMAPAVSSSMAHIPSVTQVPLYNPAQTYSSHRLQNMANTFQGPTPHDTAHTNLNSNTLNQPRPNINRQGIRISDDETSMDDYGDENEQDGEISYNMEDSIAAVMELEARQNAQGQSLRSFTSFIDRADMLSTYNPSSRSSPLNDSMTARIFCHFVHVTGPSMSMFERNPANPSLMLQGKSIPQSQQHIWTCKYSLISHLLLSLYYTCLAQVLDFSIIWNNEVLSFESA
jgi:hypothetical protein